MGTSVGLFLHDGARWTDVPLPDGFGDARFLSGLDDGAVWIGDGEQAVLFDHGDWGEPWSVGTTGISTGAQSRMVATSKSELFVSHQGQRVMQIVDGDIIAHDFPDAEDLQFLTGAGPGEVWVVDRDRTNFSARGIYRWDGTMWSLINPWSTGTVNGFTALGGGEFLLLQRAEINHYRGGEYDMDSPLARGFETTGWDDSIYSVVVTSDTTAWAAGTTGHIIRHDTEPGWTHANGFPNGGLGRGVAVAPGELWVPGVRYLHHLVGGQWEQIDRGGAIYARTIFKESSTSLWSAFSNRGIHHFDGNEWSLWNDDDLIDDAGTVWAQGTDVWTVLENRTVLRFDGAVWTPVDTGLADVDGLAGPAANALLAYGKNAERLSAMRRFDGVAWSDVDLQGATVTGTYADDTGTLWMVVTVDGAPSVWSVTADGITDHGYPSEVEAEALRDVWASGPEDMWLSGSTAGADLRVGHWDGATWTPYNTRVRGVVASDGVDVFLHNGNGVLKLRQ